MTTITFFIIFIPILAILLLSINLILAPHNPYQEKDSVFECGFHSFLGQNRTQFSISFFIFALLFLLFDLEILLVYPYSVSGYNNDIYGLAIMLMFFIALTLGFIFELGKNALTIDSKQTFSDINHNPPKPHAFTGLSLESGPMVTPGLVVGSALGTLLYGFALSAVIVATVTVSYICYPAAKYLFCNTVGYDAPRP
jgi:NADH-ubiquinone oxidoreductase chain 3